MGYNRMIHTRTLTTMLENPTNESFSNGVYLFYEW